MNNITVTSPLLPPLDELIPYLEKIWDSRWVTNNGTFHQDLERRLADYLGVEFLSLFTNGTLPLVTALQALRITGEVITTPYSFVATSHSIWWNGLTPVFVDVDPETGNLNPGKIEAAITTRTTAIMPVHVYGNPCDVDCIQRIAEKYGLKVIYDAAHAFGVRVSGQSVLNAGDMSALSFHATKTYTTIEGGALVCHSADMKRKIDYLKNFGFQNETMVVAPGINSKMDEIRAAVGILNLKYVDGAIARRKEIAGRYRSAFFGVPGLRFFREIPGVTYNYSYFPVFVDATLFGESRDELYSRLKEEGILGRRYFFPLITDFSPYKGYDSARKNNIPVAVKMAEEVLCLPIHDHLSEEEQQRVIDCVLSR